MCNEKCPKCGASLYRPFLMPDNRPAQTIIRTEDSAECKHNQRMKPKPKIEDRFDSVKDVFGADMIETMFAKHEADIARIAELEDRFDDMKRERDHEISRTAKIIEELKAVERVSKKLVGRLANANDSEESLTRKNAVLSRALEIACERRRQTINEWFYEDFNYFSLDKNQNRIILKSPEVIAYAIAEAELESEKTNASNNNRRS